VKEKLGCKLLSMTFWENEVMANLELGPMNSLYYEYS
jgi:hypothetical protein